MSEPKELKSINNKDVYGSPNKKDIGTTAYRVMGYATGYFIYETKYGENTGIKGDFVAVNNKGERFSSHCAFLPNSLTNDIVKRLDQGEIDVAFTADIATVESDKSPSGYAWIAQEPQTEERRSRMAEMLEQAEKDNPAMLENSA